MTGSKYHCFRIEAGWSQLRLIQITLIAELTLTDLAQLYRSGYNNHCGSAFSSASPLSTAMMKVVHSSQNPGYSTAQCTHELHVLSYELSCSLHAVHGNKTSSQVETLDPAVVEAAERLSHNLCRISTRAEIILNCKAIVLF